ncbi:selenocysteine-specific translation elongation factor [Luteibacter pinisoli]|uniref:Selenocysteine-specific elongation factor n=1 Tax=Luteibacter pinisoli TaxID=2589080 RepID=A0A4Y5Z8S4_9GAMM|nr:selenocysteine-specific translation elongation factor [Luteibacter pinisoli]
MIVGTAGHIDHGKTSLVRALTGVPGDRLKEEKARGITIDLGFAYLPLPDGPTLGFIDVPGHEKFVRTMVAGASGIDVALLVVAADDGVMPQTREHLAILDLLGIERGIVALTKADAVGPDRIADVAAQVREMVEGTTLAEAEILPVSAVTGLGMDALHAKLAAEAWTRHAHHDNDRFRLAVDRVFTLPGIGLVVTGTVLSGAIQVKDAVVISPSGLPARVRSIHAQDQDAEEGCAGDRVALNLAGPDITKDAIHRGDMVVDPFLHAPTDRIDARLRLLPGEPRAITSWFPARLHHASADVGARVVLLDGEQLRPGDVADVQLVLDRPIAAAALDRFVLRDTTAQRTVGGGFFIDLRAPARQRRTPQRLAEREALSQPDPTDSLRGLLDTPPFARDLEAFARDRALAAGAVDRAVAPLSPVLFNAGDGRTALSPLRWQQFVEALAEALAAFHGEHPDLQGLPRETLRRAILPRLPAAAFVQALQHPDVAARVVRDGAFLRLASHTPTATPEDEAAWQLIAPLLGGDERFRPPRVRDIAALLGRPENEIRQRLKSAARRGLADQVAHDHFFLRPVMHEMVLIAADIAAHAPDGRFTAAEFRDRLDNGRKVAIQILECFDRQGVMLNRGTRRSLRADYLDLYGREASPVGRPDFKSG